MHEDGHWAGGSLHSFSVFLEELELLGWDVEDISITESGTSKKQKTGIQVFGGLGDANTPGPSRPGQDPGHSLYPYSVFCFVAISQ